MTRAAFKINLLALVISVLWTLSVSALDWPQEITTDQGTIIVYQPQPDKLAGDVLASPRRRLPINMARVITGNPFSQALELPSFSKPPDRAQARFAALHSLSNARFQSGRRESGEHRGAPRQLHTPLPVRETQRSSTPNSDPSAGLSTPSYALH